MFLTQEIRSDRTYAMCGILPASTDMTSRIQALGYVKGTSVGGVSYLPPSLGFTGHEFHYSRVNPEHDARYALRLLRGKGIDSGNDGMAVQNTIGCYTHAYFSPPFAMHFVDAAARYSRR
jgi:cobyrinic acid a,c-diamide synthase